MQTQSIHPFTESSDQAVLDANRAAKLTEVADTLPKPANGLASIALPSPFSSDVFTVIGATTSAINIFDTVLVDWPATDWPATHAALIAELQRIQ